MRSPHNPRLSPDQLERQTDLLMVFQRTHETLTELVAATRGLILNQVLSTELATIGAGGTWTRDYSVPYGSVAVQNLSPRTMTVSGGPPQLSAPGGGTAIQTLPPFAAAVINLASATLTIYGTAGDTINVQVFARAQPPFYAFGTAALVAAAVDVANSATTGGAAPIAATLPGVAGKTTYLTGFEVTGSGATAASVQLVTVTGVVGGPLSYDLAIPAGIAVGITPLTVEFARPIPATAPNTAILVNVPGFGAGNTAAAVVAHGYQL
ncbi:MAG TPA: hypothetical protein VKQ71_17670 [Acidimicrobiales bacterium]|nr:hypothetical protein [Acidimicrobiales bacterium]